MTTEFEREGNTYTVSGVEAAVSATDAGTYPVAVTGTPMVRDADGNDVTSQFVVSTGEGTLTINPRTVILTSADAEKEYDGTALTDNTVEVTGDGFAEGEGAEYTFTGTQTIVGSSANTFAYSLNEGTKASNYDISVVAGTLTVTSRETAFTITVTPNSGSAMYDGSEHAVEGFETLTFEVEGNTYTVSGIEATVTGTDAGSYPVIVTGTPVIKDAQGNEVTGEFSLNIAEAFLTITPREVVLTSASSEKTYDGTALTNNNVEVTGDGFVEGEGATYSFTGTRTLPGTADNSFTYVLNDNTKAQNYVITTENGTLTVLDRMARYEIMLMPNSDSALYDGSEHTVNGFVTTEFEREGNTYTVSGMEASVSATDAGTYPVAVTGTPVVRDADGNDVTSQFVVSTGEGTLTINPRTVILTSADAEKEYDGTALTDNTVEVTGDGFAEGEGAEYTFTGTQTIVGSSANTFAYSLNEGTKASNYDISVVAGTLTVTSRETAFTITVTPNSGSAMYDGSEHAVEGFETLTFEVEGNTYTVSGIEATVTGTDAGSYPVIVTGTPVIKDAQGNEVTGEFSLNIAEAFLTITPREVVLTSASSEKTYDGTALTNNNVEVTGDGFVEGEGATYSFTGTRTLPGTADNSFTYVLNGNTKAQNYVITTENGTLTIENVEDEYKMTFVARANSGSAKYDGNAHTVNGLIGTTFVMNGQYYSVEGLQAEGLGIDAGEYPVTITGTPVVRDANGNEVTSQFNIQKEDGLLKIEKRNVTLRSASLGKQYDGMPLTSSEIFVEGEGFAANEGADYAVSGSRLIAGTSPNTFTYTLSDNTNEDNYNISTEYGTLTIFNREAKYEIDMKPNTLSVQYDGNQHSVSGFTSNAFTVHGLSVTVEGLEVEASGKDAGTYPVEVTGIPVIRDAMGNDVSNEFIVNVADAALTITKRNIILTSGSAEKAYDGTALTNENVAVTGDGFVENEAVAYEFNEGQLLPGSRANSFTYTWNDNTNADNYTVTSVFGILQVTNRDALYDIHIQPRQLTEMYDGTEKSIDGFETLTFTIGGQTYTIEGIEASVSGTHAGTYPMIVTGTPVVKDAGGNDVTDQFALHYDNADLTILPRNITFTSTSRTKVYDGTTLTDHEIRIGADGFVQGEGASFLVSGARTIPGTSENTFSYALNEGTLASDYNVSTVFGTLTVTPRPEDALYEITVKAEGGTYLYDGNEHTAGLAEDTITFTNNGHAYTLSGLTSYRSEKDAGTYTVNITGTPLIRDEDGKDVTDQFMVHTESAVLKIQRRKVILTSGSYEHPYTGRTYTNETVDITGDGFANGEGAEMLFNGGQRLVGTSANTFTYQLHENTNPNNYEIITNYGTLTVTNRDARYEVTVTAKSGEYLYDGNEKSITGIVRRDFSVDGEEYYIEGLEATASATDAGEYPVRITGEAKVYDSQGNDVSEQFTVLTVDGLLTINPRYVVLTSADAEKMYDGNPLEMHEVTVSEDGFAQGEGAEYIFTGTRTLLGSTENTFTYALTAGTNADNYTIETVFGRLNILNREAKYTVALQANSDTVVYDGQVHEVSGFETNTFTIEGHTYSVIGVEAGAQATEAGIYTTEVTGMPQVVDEDGNDVTDQFAVEIRNGTLTILNTYLLTIRYVDTAGNTLAPPFTGRYQAGASFGPIRSPRIAGYTPQYDAIVSSASGMPETDVVVDVVYRQDRQDNIEPQNPSVQPQNPNEPNVQPDEENITNGGGRTYERDAIAEVEMSDEGEAELVEMEDEPIPLAPARAGYWALLNLVITIVVTILSIILWIAYFFKKKDDEEEEDKEEEQVETEDEEKEEETKIKKKTWLRILSILLAIVTIIAFILTEDMTLTMAFVDKWTILMIILLIIQILIVFFSKKKKEDEEEKDDTEEPVAA